MDIHLTPEQTAQFNQLAAYEGRQMSDLAQEALMRYLNDEIRFIEAIRRGEAALDRGEHLSHADVGVRLSKLLAS
jgi:predicted transcriptional regulator